ncbi:MAG TPA: glycosyltransferase family 2 protein [Deltaproteobacteria bacterium]|nr:glycosyltransferase family 2 protein [Deltaproteobacteria bacterium]HQJ08510.1 glycosyltransferase family 2 protein [Deltaproteobacteria bacterium]
MFSVVIPLYNMRQYIARAVKSVLDQSLDAFEIIVVDDGSTDGSAAAVEAIHDPRIRLVRQDNAGVSAARNKGISLARYDRICFLDADDMWDAGFLEAILRLKERYPQAGIYGTGYRLVFPKGRDVEVTAAEAAHQDTTLLITDYLHRAKSTSLLHSSGVMIPRRTFDEIGGFLVGEHYGEDQEMWTRIALHYPVGYDTRILFSFFQTGSENKPRFGKIQQYDPKVRMLERYLIENGNGPADRDMIRSHLKSHLTNKCLSFIYANKRSAAVSYMNKNSGTWTPLLSLLVGYPPAWPFLRFFSLVYRFCNSRLMIRMVGGKRASHGVLERLKKRSDSCHHG